MSDVDDELLALAGGGESSDDEAPRQRTKRSSAAGSDNGDGASRRRSRSASGSRAASRGGSPANSDDSPRPAKRSPPKKARRRARSADESEEEGEARSSRASTPESLQSAPMDESDSDSDGDAVPNKKTRGGAVADDDDEDDNKYPVDGLFANHDEKEEIMNMREVDREQILAERAQEKDRIHQNKLLRQLVSNDEQRKKRSASAADLDDGQRKTARVRTKVGGTKAGEAHSAMDTLKTRRAEKSERNRRREEDRERRKDRPSSRGGHSDDYHDGGGGADSDDDGNGDDSDVEWAKPSHKSRSPDGGSSKVAQVTELRDVERVRLSRSRFGQVCFYPGFEAAITGTFVRISIGPDPDTREPVYRMAAVKGFTKGKPYAITGPQGQMIVTDQYVVAAHGKAQREWPFLACSDSPFTEGEWSRYQKVCHADGVSLPKRGLLLNKADDINQLINRRWTEQELADKVSRQQELKNRFSGVDRLVLEHAIKEARAQGNHDKVLQLQEELERLETPRLAFKTSLTPNKKTNSGLTQQERLAQLNAENRRYNAEAVRKAQRRERMKARDMERKIEPGDAAAAADQAHDTGSPEKKKKAAAAATAISSTTALPHLIKQQQQQQKDKNGLPLLHRPIGDDDIIASLDLDIDESLFD